ncbi:unnamed protein product [Symbiodinium natans]|uniref:Uncharacterized protein n=1 Tax=Symbiodinium natans TaxID=878477 RepID=A0A812UQC8_9DINO|nr:unnamed protein product [Symbiodinium natans]
MSLYLTSRAGAMRNDEYEQVHLVDLHVGQDTKENFDKDVTEHHGQHESLEDAAAGYVCCKCPDNSIHRMGDQAGCGTCTELKQRGAC